MSNFGMVLSASAMKANQSAFLKFHSVCWLLGYMFCWLRVIVSRDILCLFPESLRIFLLKMSDRSVDTSVRCGLVVEPE